MSVYLPPINKMTPIPLCVPHFPGNERRYVNEAIDSTMVSSVGPFVERFEREFANVVGASHAVACASGTAALHLALRALGVGRDDLVLCSDFTFIASANPIVHQGAKPLFIDSEVRSWNLDPALVAETLEMCAKQGRLPKAVICVHILGQPADLGPIVDACAQHGVPLIEDAAEALGARYTAAYPHPACAGRQVGTIGRIGCFSFNGNKLITTGGGGMLTTHDATLARRLKHLSTQAKLPGLAFVHDEIGYNYRLTNLAAALGLGQLENLTPFLLRKRAIAERYRAFSAALADQYHLSAQPILHGTEPSNWLPSLLIPGRRDEIVTALTQASIQARPLWVPLSAQPCYLNQRNHHDRQPGIIKNSVAQRLSVDGISLPCSVSLSDDEQEHVLSVMASALHGVAHV